MTRYRYTIGDAEQFSKHGIDLAVYGHADPSVSFAHVHVEAGHFQEFYNVQSTYAYYVVSGAGTFHLDDEAVRVGATDLVVVPPGTRIHYFGTMELLLTVSPAFDESDERHVRFLTADQAPDGSGS